MPPSMLLNPSRKSAKSERLEKSGESMIATGNVWTSLRSSKLKTKSISLSSPEILNGFRIWSIPSKGPKMYITCDSEKQRHGPPGVRNLWEVRPIRTKLKLLKNECCKKGNDWRYGQEKKNNENRSNWDYITIILSYVQNKVYCINTLACRKLKRKWII